MKLSTDRILTTHVGSLPRDAAALEFLLRRERGEDYDEAKLEEAFAAAVENVVARQIEIGIDVVSDGEMSKIGYATYVKDRLSGFGGHYPRLPSLDLAPHPELREAMARLVGTQSFRRPACIGPIELVEREALERDIRRFRRAVESHRPVDAFMNAASPGVISAFQTNRFYPTHDAYVDAIAAAMQPEYEAIADAGFVLQLDCPDLAMARHTGFQTLTEEQFLERAEYQVEALNRALAHIPAAAMRMHVCWGNYEGPHDHDIPLERILGIVLRAKPAGILFEAANPRHRHEWTVWRDAEIPEDKILIPGCLMSTTNYVEHPELVAQQICRYADLVGRERVIAGTDCGFGTFAGLWRVAPAVAYKKLEALVQGAEIASRRLWGRSPRPLSRL
ncbi:MAG TPA: cobalamin-independent methionine synthase II family protein [Gammaproteobacteria bacterium]|nr:cobalamin-independent methionine synthase II family protein [Gammaproteobacteria bacterium]